MRMRDNMDEKKEMYQSMGIDGAVYEFGERLCKKLKERFDKIDETAEYNQLKVIRAMQENRVSEACLYSSSGYGISDATGIKKCSAYQRDTLPVETYDRTAFLQTQHG